MRRTSSLAFTVPAIPIATLATLTALFLSAVLLPLEAQPRSAWPSLKSQLQDSGAPDASPLAQLIRENQDFSLLRPEEASDSLPIPPWLRVLWRRSHPMDRVPPGDPTAGYPWVLPEIHQWMLLHPDLQPGEDGELDFDAREKGASATPAGEASSETASEDLSLEADALEPKLTVGPNTNVSGASSRNRAESDLRINFWNPSQVIAASNDLGGPGQAQFYSTDGGESWQQTALPRVLGDVGHSDPTVDWTSDGTAWSITIGLQVAPGNNLSLALRSYRSSDGGATWTFDQTISGNHALPDKQMIWVDHSNSSPHRDNLYVCYHNGPYPFVVRRVARTGEWEAPIQLDSDIRRGTSVGCDIKSNNAGVVYAFWPSTSQRLIYQTKSTDGGATWSAPRSIFKTYGNAGMITPGFAIRTILLYTASAAFKAGKKDMAYLTWTDLSGVAGCKSPADQPRTNAASKCKTRIWVARSTNGGKTWGRAVKVNDSAERNDQFHPWIAVDPNSGAMALIYYDTKGDPERHRAHVYAQTSTDSGAHWSAPVRVTSAPTDESAFSLQGFQFGDYNALSGIAGRFLPTWTDKRGGFNDQIWTAPITIP